MDYKVEIKSNFAFYFISNPILVLINFSPSKNLAEQFLDNLSRQSAKLKASKLQVNGVFAFIYELDLRLH